MLSPRFQTLCLVALAAGAAPGAARAMEIPAPGPPAAGAPIVARLAPPAAEEWAQLSFWHRLARSRPHYRERDTMLSLLNPVLAADPDDLLASFLLGRTLLETEGEAPDDSVTLDRIRAGGEAADATPGSLVGAAGLALARRDAERWRTTIDRARSAYERAGRADDAFGCLLLKVNFRAGLRDEQLLDEDLEELRLAAESSGDPVRIADHRILLGKALYTRDLESSVAPREEAVRLLEPASPNYQLAYARWGLGNSLRRLSRLEEAFAQYELAVEEARAVGAVDLEASAHLGLGQVYRRQADPAAALAEFELSAAGHEATRDYGQLVSTTLNFRALHHELGDHAAARAAAERGLELAREYGSARSVVAALDGFASEEAILGRLDSARLLYGEAIERARQSGANRELIYLHYHLSGLESDLGDLDAAERIAAEGLSIAEDLGDLRGEDLLRGHLVRITLHRGEFEAALAAAKELAERPAIDSRTRHDAQRLRAQATVGLGRFEEALEIYDGLVEDMAETNASPSRRARVLEQRGHLLIEMGRGPEALESFEAGLRLADGDPVYEYVSRLGVGAGLAYLGRWEEARPLLEEGLAVVEQVNSGLTVGEERADYLVNWYDDYVRLARAYLETGRPVDAFATFERARAREMRRALRTGAPGLETKVSPALAYDLARTEGELSLVQKSLVEQYALAPSDRIGALGDLEARADALKRRRGELVQAIEREQPDFAREIGLLPQAGLAELQSILQSDELVLATMSGHREVLVFGIGPESFDWRSVPWPEDEVRRTVSACVDAVRGPAGVGGPGGGGGGAAQELAERLLPEVGARAPQALFVLPDGAFHRLPFEILPLPDGRRVVEASEVSYASSATLLAAAAGAEAGVGAGDCVLVAFGDPAVAPARGDPESAAATRGGLPVLRALPHARREVGALGELLEHACVRVGEEATEAAFFRDAARAPVVHVAAHAYVDDAHPGYSGVVLASDRESADRPATDGIVQAFEVVRAEVPAGLVTLSACETGAGRWLRGEGLIGLARAFRLAGARSLVVSLWEVDDEQTADFMVRFYEHLIAGATPAAALRATKLSFLGSRADAPEAASPVSTRGVARRTAPVRGRDATWAAFVLLGPGPNPFPGER